MLQEACQDCKLSIDELRFQTKKRGCGGITYQTIEIIAGFTCPWGINEEFVISFDEDIERYITDPALIHSFNTTELMSPGRELQAAIDRIRLEKCPLTMGLRNSLPVLD